MLKMISEYKLELTSAPFTKEDSKVYFVASEFNLAMNLFVESHIEELKDIFSKENLEFQYVQGQFGQDINGEDVLPTLFSYKISKPTKQGIAFSAYHLDVGALKTDSLMLLQFEDVARVYSRKDAIDYREKTDDPEVVDLLFEMERIARALKLKGVKTAVFDEMLESLEKPSELNIGERGDIFFPDLGNMKIKLNPMEKTLYLFMLQHPEGVLPDALVGYRKDILRIYKHHTIFDDMDTIENSVDSLLAEDKNVLYANVSRIKEKFSKKMGAKLAKPYVIERDKSGLYKIALPEEYIHWDKRF